MRSINFGENHYNWQGQISSNKGKKMSEEQKKKISETKKLKRLENANTLSDSNN